MAKEIVIPGTNLLNSPTDDWGGVNNTGAAITKYGTEIPDGYKWGVNFAEVERFIKSQLGSEASKIGYFAMENIDGTNYLLGFASLEAYQAWSLDHDDPDNQPIVTAEMETHEKYMSRVATNSDTDNVIIAEPSHTVGVRFTSLMYEGGEYVNSGISGMLTFLLSIDDGVNFTEVGRRPIVSREETSSTFDSFEVGQYLRDGYRNIIAVRASFTGEDGNTYTSRPLTVATVTYTTLSLECLSDWHLPIASSDIAADGLRLRYRARHAVDAVLHISVECTNGTLTTTHQLPASNSGTAQFYTIHDTMSYGLTLHGVRKVTAWLTCSDGSGGSLTGHVLTNRFMVVDAASAGANIDKPYLVIQDEVNAAENFMQTRICDIAVYSPDGSAVTLDISITSEAEDYPGGTYDVYYAQQLIAESGVRQQLKPSIEIEDKQDDSIPTYVRIWSGNDNILQRSIGRPFIYVAVDNSEAYAPKAGASFILNPRLRNNAEEHPDTIINARNGNVVTSSWQGFSYGNNDAWVEAEDGMRVLRVLAGQRLQIQYNPFAQFISAPNSSMTFEMDIRVRNVTDEASAVLGVSEMVSGHPRGLIIRPMSGNLFALGEPNDSETNFRWQEGERTHIAINVNNQVDTDINGDGLVTEDYYNTQGRPSTTRMFARVFINGNIEREIMLSGTNAQEFCTDLMSNGGIIIGQDNADIDIYSIRCYERMPLESKDVFDNYVSTLPTSEQKRAVHDANEIMSGTRVDVQKVMALGKRVLILHGKEPYHKDTSASGNWWEIHQYDDQGNEIPELSGTICKETGFSQVKRQGSTANTYYYSNLQTKIDDAGTIDVRLEDIHESMTVSEPYEKDGVLVVDIYGCNLGKKDPVTDVAKQYPINDGVVTVPDGWIDGNGKYRGMGFMIAEGTPFAAKLVLKINYASSMQSHVTGCLKLFDDLHRAVVGPNAMQQRVPSARVSKYTEPVFFFTQLDDSAPVVFRGMGNFGAGKMDKPTWGYVKSEHPMFAMIEGSDNDQHLTDCRVPFATDADCPECITYDPDEEGYFYGNFINLDYDGGKTDSEGYPDAAITARLKETWNWIYLHAPNIRRFNGTYIEFLASSSDTAYKYWCNSGPEAFILKRYDAKNDVWRDAGLWDETGKTYDAIDLRTYALTAAAYDTYSASLNTANPISQVQLNSNFIAALAADANKYIGFYFNVRSLKFHYALINHFMAGTDNCSKNTYFVLMPYAQDVTIDGETRQCYLWELHQDDVDTILITDNNGRSTKPYYIDRLHPYDDDDLSECCYKGVNNQLFNLCEAMWEREGESSELSSMLREIFTAMVGLVTDADVLAGYTKTLWGCMQKYLLSSQHYFPQMAYNEQARIRYEYPATLGFISDGKGSRQIPPITQSMGSQLQAESQFIKRRLLYMASYAAWGDFAGNSSSRVGLADAEGSFGFEPRPLPNGNTMRYYFDVVPHQYLYPSGSSGQSPVMPRHRVAPGETYRLNIGPATGDTGVSLFAVHLYRSVGNVGDQSTNPNIAATVNGNRLTEFVSEPSVQYSENGRLIGAYRPSQLNFGAKFIKSISLKDSGIGGTLDLSQMVRLETLDIRGTYITEVKLPESSRLHTVLLPATLTKLVIDAQENIGNTALDANARLSMQGAANLTEVTIKGNAFINSRSVLVSAYSAGASLSQVDIDNIDWTGANSATADFVDWLAGLTSSHLEGAVAVSDSVSFALKTKMLAKWTNLGDTLTVTYTVVPITSVKTGGDGYISAAGQYQYGVVPVPSSGNDVVSVLFSAAWSQTTAEELSDYVDVDTYDFAHTGILNVLQLPSTNLSITVTATVVCTTNGTLTANYVVGLFEHALAKGDRVFSDGSFADKDNPLKTTIAICFDATNRLAVSLKNVGSNTNKWGLSSAGISGVTISDYSYGCYNTGAEIANYTTVTKKNLSGLRTGNPFKEDRQVFAGQFNTFAIIYHRNRVLDGISGYGTSPSSEIAASATTTETQKLSSLISAAAARSQHYDCFYWPAASYCYAYEPTVKDGEALADKFKAHKWWLPSIGELKVLRQAGLSNIPGFTDFSTNVGYWSSSQSDRTETHSYALKVDLMSDFYQRYTSYCVRAIVEI